MLKRKLFQVFGIVQLHLSVQSYKFHKFMNLMIKARNEHFCTSCLFEVKTIVKFVSLKFN